MISRRELFGGALLLLPVLRAARAEACNSADPNELGPFYRAGAPERATLCGPSEPGTPYQLSGLVLGEGCAPLPGALVEVWHADDKGQYDMTAPGKPRDPGVYHLRGLLRTGRSGEYEVHTIRPGHYEDRARHIHYLVHAEGYEPFATQSYFPGDPRLATDRIARPRNAVRNGTFTVLLRRQRPNPPEAIARFGGYEGAYRIVSERMDAALIRKGNALFLTFEGMPDAELRFDAPDRFRIVEFDARCSVERRPDGKVAAILLQVWGARKPFRLERTA